jgi:hypothetical protein
MLSVGLEVGISAQSTGPPLQRATSQPVAPRDWRWTPWREPDVRRLHFGTIVVARHRSAYW